MFGSTPHSGHGSNGSSDQVLTPVRFVWPYGGKRVSVSGTFNGWRDHVVMSPIEGCPTVFQAICTVPPGYHQYKFYVDGVWRHDEHQPLVRGNYGMVNTILIAGETHSVPTNLTVEMQSRSNMEVDDAFENSVAMPDGSSQEAASKVLESDLEISRNRISTYLSSHKAYELLPESGKVIALDVNLPVQQAFHILHEQGLTLAPLWDFNKGQFVGVISPSDFILMLREIDMHGSNLTEEELETHTILAWKENKTYLNRHIYGNDRLSHRRLVYAVPNDSLRDIAVKILQKRVASVPIIHSSSEYGSYPQLLHIASLAGILKCICRYFRHSASSLPILQQPLCSIPMGTWVSRQGSGGGGSLATLKPSASLGAALSLLVEAEVSSIPIVDDHDSLLDIYSRSDITALANDKAYKRIRLDETSIQQALQLCEDPAHGPSGQRCHICLRTDPLHKAMERLANPGVRRLVVVEARTKRVEGIISLNDVFRFLLGI